MKGLYFGLVAMALVVQLSSCGSSSEESLSSAVPQLAVTSPTAASDSSTAALRIPSFFTHPVQASAGWVKVFFSKHVITSAKADPSELKDLAALKEEIVGDRLEKTTLADCLEGLNTVFAPPAPATTCYGPKLFYANHPNNGGTDPGPSMGDTNPSLPGGDVGIWTATEGADSEACTAAKIREIVLKGGGLVNSSLKFFASMACVAKVKGEAFPDEGGSIDISADLQSGITGSTFTKGLIERLTNTEAGKMQFRISTTATIGSKPHAITLTHRPLNAENTEFEGRLTGYVDIPAGGGNLVRHGFSVIYNQSGSTLKFLLKSGGSSTFTTTAPTMFDSNGDFDFTQTGWQQNGYRTLVEMNTTTNLGTIYSSWQAGRGDGNSRTFHANTFDDAGTDKGFGYFAFGDSLLNSSSNNYLGGMICNWAGPNNSHTLLTASSVPVAQAQTMSRNATSGVYTVDSNFITYAPTNACTYTAGGTQFRVSTTDASDLGSNATYNFPNVVSHSMTTYGNGSVGTIPTITEPTF